MRKCFVITVDPQLVQLAGLDETMAELGYRVEIAPRVRREAADEEDLFVVDVRASARDILAQFGRRPVTRRRVRMVFIMNERASSEQRAEFLDVGALSAVPANPTRLADLLAQVLREIADMEPPRP